MKLGKALATGVAEERPQAHDDELALTREIGEIEENAEIQDVEASESQEAPATR